MLARPVTFRTAANQTNNEIKTMIKYFMFCVCICNISVCWIFKWCWLGYPDMLFWLVPLANERASWSIFPMLKILYLSSAFAELCCKSCSCTCVGLHHYRSVGNIYRGVHKQYTLTCIRCWRAPWTCAFVVGEHLQGQETKSWKTMLSFLSVERTLLNVLQAAGNPWYTIDMCSHVTLYLHFVLLINSWIYF